MNEMDKENYGPKGAVLIADIVYPKDFRERMKKIRPSEPSKKWTTSPLEMYCDGFVSCVAIMGTPGEEGNKICENANDFHLNILHSSGYAHDGDKIDCPGLICFDCDDSTKRITQLQKDVQNGISWAHVCLLGELQRHGLIWHSMVSDESPGLSQWDGYIVWHNEKPTAIYHEDWKGLPDGDEYSFLKISLLGAPGRLVTIDYGIMQRMVQKAILYIQKKEKEIEFQGSKK